MPLVVKSTGVEFECAVCHKQELMVKAYLSADDELICHDCYIKDVPLVDVEGMLVEAAHGRTVQ
jgi:hypothetical protein